MLPAAGSGSIPSKAAVGAASRLGFFANATALACAGDSFRYLTDPSSAVWQDWCAAMAACLSAVAQYTSAPAPPAAHVADMCTWIAATNLTRGCVVMLRGVTAGGLPALERCHGSQLMQALSAYCQISDDMLMRHAFSSAADLDDLKWITLPAEAVEAAAKAVLAADAGKSVLQQPSQQMVIGACSAAEALLGKECALQSLKHVRVVQCTFRPEQAT